MPRGNEQPPLTIEPLRGGWAHVTWRGGQADEVVAYVRFERGDEPFTMKPAELRVMAPWLERHRELPLGRVENAAHANAVVRFELLEFIDERHEGVDPVDMYLMKQSVQRGMSPRYKLERPAGRRLDDAFYGLVARAYADAVAWGMNPRKTLAADSDTPADTVARWIGQARKRGKLSPAEPGKASGVVADQGGDGG